jgi:hypothetical protein
MCPESSGPFIEGPDFPMKVHGGFIYVFSDSGMISSISCSPISRLKIFPKFDDSFIDISWKPKKQDE